MANRVSSTSEQPAKPTVNVEVTVESAEPVNAVNEYIVQGWYVDPNGKRLRPVEVKAEATE